MRGAGQKTLQAQYIQFDQSAPWAGPAKLRSITVSNEDYYVWVQIQLRTTAMYHANQPSYLRGAGQTSSRHSTTVATFGLIALNLANLVTTLDLQAILHAHQYSLIEGTEVSFRR